MACVCTPVVKASWTTMNVEIHRVLSQFQLLQFVVRQMFSMEYCNEKRIIIKKKTPKPTEITRNSADPIERNVTIMATVMRAIAYPRDCHVRSHRRKNN